MKKKISILAVLLISLLITGCASTPKDSITYVNTSYEEIIDENIKDGVYLFSRKDCPACISLFGLMDEAFDGDKTFFDGKEIHVIETTDLSSEEKANVSYMYDLVSVPRLIKIKNSEIIYDKEGGFSSGNITEELSKAFKAE